MKSYVLLTFLLVTAPLRAQSFVAASHSGIDKFALLPRPYVFAGPEFMGGGYAPFAALFGAGLRIDSNHFLFDVNADYDNGRKRNDGTQPNPKGHDRGLRGSIYFRLSSGWSFGGGARWSQLSTTNYTKTSWRPTFGGSKDFFVRDCLAENCRGQFTMRIGADYVTKGRDWQNGSQGPLISFYVPSPSLKRHLFFREQMGVYRFHDTVTDRTDAYLTREQTGVHHITSYLELTLLYRF